VTPSAHEGPVTVDAPVESGIETELLATVVARTIDEEGAPVREISLTLLDDDEMRALNRSYLDRDYPTDVLAFTLSDADDLVGDVYVGWRQARRQAKELGEPYRMELARLAIHGTLHVLGHDHPEGDERYASAMFHRQEAILDGLRPMLEAAGAGRIP